MYNIGWKVKMNNKDNVKKIQEVLRARADAGLTITELVKLSKLTRSAVRTTLAKLEGAKKVSIRKIGMAKVYILKSKKKK